MHPVIKLISLITVAVFLTQGNPVTLLITGALMLPFYFVIPSLWQSAFSMISRLKLFFISIILVYLFLSPATWSELSDMNILLQVSAPGLFRIAVLIIIIFAVNLYLKTTTKEDILASLIWLFKPLNYLNITIDRFALRAVMTLDYIEQLNHKLTQYKQRKLQQKRLEENAGTSLRQKLRVTKQVFLNLVSQSAIILQDVLNEAENTSGKQYTIDCLQAPSFIQFIIPVLLFTFLFITI